MYSIPNLLQFFEDIVVVEVFSSHIESKPIISQKEENWQFVNGPQ
jgi:hypothetical protein